MTAAPAWRGVSPGRELVEVAAGAIDGRAGLVGRLIGRRQTLQKDDNIVAVAGAGRAGDVVDRPSRVVGQRRGHDEAAAGRRGQGELAGGIGQHGRVGRGLHPHPNVGDRLTAVHVQDDTGDGCKTWAGRDKDSGDAEQTGDAAQGQGSFDHVRMSSLYMCSLERRGVGARNRPSIRQIRQWRESALSCRLEFVSHDTEPCLGGRMPCRRMLCGDKWRGNVFGTARRRFAARG